MARESQRVKDFIDSDNITLSVAMERMNTNATGILFLTDEKGVIDYCITDGDVRRFLLSGGELEALAREAANCQPKVANSLNQAIQLYHKRNLIAVPVVDKNSSIVDIYLGEGFDGKEKPALNVPVVINAGGKGTRLYPLTKVLPKPLIPVGELPIIELIMNEYKSYSCTDFHIIVNYKKELMKAYFQENDVQYNVTWYDEKRFLGTGGGLRLLQGSMSSTFFFANCDALLTANYESILDFHRQNENYITMICAYKNVSIPYGVVEMGKQGLIKSMREKPVISFLTNTGIYIVEPEVIDDIEDNEVVGFPEIIEREKQKGRKVAVYPVSENDWMDMGQLPELEKMRARLYGE